ncbi:RNA-binding protein 20-like isoform X2 [Brienomyrus brachyistius]|nr:RNA-binding protein 20-like isoform X2 [Brienomyrus brachyistius]
MYPDWDCRSDSAKGDHRQLGAKREVDTTERNRHGSAQPPAARPISGEKWRPGKDEERSKVIRVKFPPDAVDESYLMKLVQPFGSVVNVSVFPTKAFLEMKTFHQSEDIVKFFTKNPAMVHGSQVQFNLSATYTFSQNSRVVCFSRLPPGKEKNAELIAMAKRFGQVKHSLFLPNRVFVEMTNKDDADKLVGHYASHPLKMKGKNVLVSYSTEYSTLKEESPDTNSEGSETLNSYCRRQSPSPRKSPSPRRKSSEMEDSSKPPDITTELPHLFKAETPADSVKETPLEIQGNDSDIVKSEGCLDAGNSPSPDRDQECREGNWEGHSDLDSDIEGMEVIGEDEEEGIPDEVLLELEGKNSVEEAEPRGECREDVKVDPVEAKSSDFQPGDKQTTDVTTLSYESLELQTEDPSDATSASGMPAHVQIAIEEEEPGFPESLEQCITLDELEEEDEEELEEEPVSMHDSEEVAEETSKDDAEEYFNGKVIYIKNLPKTYYTDSQFVKIVKGFGTVKRYFLIRTRKEGFIEMETHEEAQRAVKELVLRRTEIRGCPLVFQLSRKYLTLTRGWSPDREEEGESRTEQRMKSRRETGYSGSPSKSTAIQEELPAKRQCIREEEASPKKPVAHNEQLPQQQQQQPQKQHQQPQQQQQEKLKEKQQRSSSQKEVNLITVDSETKASQPSDCLDGGRDMQQIPSPKSPITQARDRPEGEGHTTEDKAKDKPEPTAEPPANPFVPYQPHTPLGQEFVHPVVCYICRLCNAIYTSEDEAKNEHCSSRSHYEKLKVHLERGTTSGLPLNMEKSPK